MKILGASSIRSDYDLMSGIYKALTATEAVDFKLLVSGAHLSDTFGYTISQIRADQLPILAEIETLLDSNSSTSRIKTASLLLQNSLHTIQAFRPNVIIFVGDREDALALAAIGAYLKIPTAHFFGGDHATDGNVDNPVRHAISKLATAHFVATDIHQHRLVRLGESPERIFVVGNPALDRFRTEPFLNRDGVLQQINMPAFFANNPYAVMIHHPILGLEDKAADEAETILNVLLREKIPTLVNTPNTDAGARSILKVYESYKDRPNLHFFNNCPRHLFINLMRHANFLIGNSSLGLVEAPSIPLGVINVGQRQQGRLAAKNVVFVEAEQEAILEAIEQINTSDFADILKAVRNPYGDGYSVERVVKLLQTINFETLLYKQEDPLEIPYP